MAKYFKSLVFFAFLLLFQASFASVIIYSPTTAAPVQKNPGDTVDISFSYTETYACGYDLNIFKDRRPLTQIASKHVEGLCTILRYDMYGGVTGFSCNRDIADVLSIPANTPGGRYTVQATVYSMSTAGQCTPASTTQVSSEEPSSIIIPDAPTELCGNGVDDDGDGLIDEGCTEICCLEICYNNIDDDGDGLIDEDCLIRLEICGNNIDDDGDGLVDEGCSQIFMFENNIAGTGGSQGEPIVLGFFETIPQVGSRSSYSFDAQRNSLPNVLLTQNLFQESVPNVAATRFNTFELSQLAQTGGYSMLAQAAQLNFAPKSFNVIKNDTTNIRNELFYTTFIGWWNVGYNLKRMYFERYNNLVQLANRSERAS